MPTDRPREVEAALIVDSDAPQAIEGRLASLRTLAEFSFLPRDTETIEDIYFDTRDRALQDRLIALRVRRSDSKVFLTVKADSRPVGASADRLEIESEWSAAALHNAFSELRNRGVGVSGSPGDLSSIDPTAVMASLGLEEVQARVTKRAPRDVVARGERTEPVAELAIDAVTYRFGEVQVRLHEVEVEAKGKGDASTVERITASLLKAFPAQLQPWAYSKLATGKAIQKFLADGRLAGLLGKDNVLRSAAYERIAELLDDER